MKYLRPLYAQVLIGITLGILVGIYSPDFGAALKPVADAFIKLIKMTIAPIIFATVVTGIAGVQDLKRLGRVGLKALLYFEVVTTLALVFGLVVVNWIRPGEGLNADPASLDASSVSAYTERAAHSGGFVDMLLHIIPNTFVDAFAKGDILQVLLLSVLFGFALARLGDHGRPVLNLLNEVARVFFGIVALITRLAPIAAFAAMGFTIGKYGWTSLASLGSLVACVYLTSAAFVFIVLGLIARLHGFSVWRLLKYIREEMLITVSASSSEPALPRMMERMEELGCPKPIVGIVLPAGYSFNLDGTSIYLTMSVVFIAQATNVPLGLEQQLGILGILLVTSKGAAAVTGSGFVTLAATLASVGHIPIAGLALLIGVDRFMSEARAVTNLCGNAVAMIIVSMWEKALDRKKASPILISPPAQPQPVSPQ